MTHLSNLKEPVCTAGFSPDGNVVVVGMTSGRWLALDSSTREVLAAHSDGNEAIGCVKFSPGNANLFAHENCCVQ